MADTGIPQEEEWRSIEGAPGYEVSSLGRVRSIERVVFQTGRWGKPISYVAKGRVLRPAAHGPYVTVALSVDGRPANKYVHRLVLTAFDRPPAQGEQCCHTNGDPRDNRAVNLRWGSASQNAHDKFRHGTHLLGERQNGAKLRAEDIRAIRRLGDAGCPYEYIMRAYGISHGNISQIVHRKTWRHVAEETYA